MTTDGLVGVKERLCVIVGLGGHAAVLIDALQMSDPDLELIALDNDKALWKTDKYGVRVVGGDDLMSQLDHLHSFVVGVGMVRPSPLRESLFDKMLAAGHEPLTLVHPSSIVAPTAEIGRGVQIMAGAIVNPGAKIGRNAIVNTGAIVEHDCIVGDHAHIATGARLAGGVKVGRTALVGVGATVLSGTTIGARALAGAGAVVVKNVQDETTVTGIPAKAAGTEI